MQERYPGEAAQDRAHEEFELWQSRDDLRSGTSGNMQRRGGQFQEYRSDGSFKSETNDIGLLLDLLKAMRMRKDYRHKMGWNENLHPNALEDPQQPYKTITTDRV